MSIKNKKHLSRPTKIRRRKLHRAEIRERLMQVGGEIIRSHNFQAVRVSEITEKAELGHGTFYNYFPTKEHLVIELSTWWTDGKFAEALEMIREGQKTVEDVFNDRRKSRWSPISLLSCLSGMLANSAIRPIFVQTVQSNRNKLEQLVSLGQELDQVRSDLQPVQLASVILEVIRGANLIAAFEAADAPPEKSTPGLKTDHMVNLFWRSFVSIS